MKVSKIDILAIKGQIGSKPAIVESNWNLISVSNGLNLLENHEKREAIANAG